MSDNVVDITRKAKINAQHSRQRILDAQASYTAMEKCLRIIEMNDMPELRSVKSMIRRTMKDMVEIGKHGKKTSKR